MELGDHNMSTKIRVISAGKHLLPCLTYKCRVLWCALPPRPYSTTLQKLLAVDPRRTCLKARQYCIGQDGKDKAVLPFAVHFVPIASV